jgi:flagellar biosynthesis/type III secretory pathway chaperone
MLEALKTLRAVLDRQKAVYGEMLTLAEQQGDALIARRTSTLQEIEARQSSLLTQAARLEAKAATALRELGGALNIEGAPTVMKVAARVSPSDGSYLTTLCHEVSAVLSRLGRLIRVNAELFESAMDCVRFTVQLMAGVGESGAGCYPSVETHRHRTSLVVDQRV